jgi:amidophosphoribosyltransferase
MQRLQGNAGIGHVRYPTAGSSSASEAQPFYVNSPFGISLAHNGNLTNTIELAASLVTKRRHVNTTSDSEILLNLLADELQETRSLTLSADEVFDAVAKVHAQTRGAYAVVATHLVFVLWYWVNTKPQRVLNTWLLLKVLL